MLKRLFDVTCSLLGLALIWPLLLVVALAIKLEDCGPVCFRQVRVGRMGELFRIWKFRTMVVNAEQAGEAITIGDDKRITRLGRWLRASKIDELPQLINVLQGEMSFVGPRPEVPQYVSLYSEEQRAVLNYRPGITDPASLKFRNENTLLGSICDPEEYYRSAIMPEKIRINLAYAQRANVLTDLVVILQTIAGIRQR